MVKAPYYDPEEHSVFFTFFDFRGDFPFDVPISFIMETSDGIINDTDIDDISFVFSILNRSGSIVSCSPFDYEFVEDLLCSWGCSC